MQILEMHFGPSKFTSPLYLLLIFRRGCAGRLKLLKQILPGPHSVRTMVPSLEGKSESTRVNSVKKYTLMTGSEVNKGLVEIEFPISISIHALRILLSNKSIMV